MARSEARTLLGLPPSGRLLLFFGFIRKYKGLHVLLQSMPRIIHALPDVKLLVAGEFYEDEASYRTLIERLGLHDHVRIDAAYVSNDAVARYFSAADIVVQPYVTATQSGVAQIAFQFERPLIVTDVGGLAEVVPHEKVGLVVPPDDPDALSAAVVRFFFGWDGGPVDGRCPSEKARIQLGSTLRGGGGADIKRFGAGTFD